MRMTKAVILAGGLGTRLSEETVLKPKPMVEIGGMPILWHIMQFYASYGVKEFIICAGYKQYVIKEFFANFRLHASDVTFDLKTGTITTHSTSAPDWKVTVVDTGEATMTGGRLKRVRDFIGDDTFFLTYGDGVSNVNLSSLFEHHKKAGKIATLTAVYPPARFGALDIENGLITHFREKPTTSERRINGGYMVLEPSFIDLIKDDSTVLEQEPLTTAAQRGELTAFEHDGFWQCMDKVHDKLLLEDIWATGNAPWKRW